MPPKKLMPAVLGGLFIGVLSVLPFINLGNLCCCLWVVGGGFLAAHLMQQNHPFPITVADGAVVGFLSGIVGALFGTIAAIPINLLMGPLQEQLLRGVLTSSGDMPPGLRDILEDMAATRASFAIGIALQFMFLLIIGAIFAPIGGMLGALFSRRPPAPAPPVPPMPPSPVSSTTDSWVPPPPPPQP